MQNAMETGAIWGFMLGKKWTLVTPPLQRGPYMSHVIVVVPSLGATLLQAEV